jgi:hypothetical protein
MSEDESAPWEPCPAYPELARLVAVMRPGWSREDLWTSILAAQSAGWSWRDTYREVMRLAWTEGETPATLRNSARRPGAAPPAPLDPGVKAELLASLASKRVTGGQPVLVTDDGFSPERGGGAAA